jgi:hypothetical protein
MSGQNGVDEGGFGKGESVWLAMGLDGEDDVVVVVDGGWWMVHGGWWMSRWDSWLTGWRDGGMEGWLFRCGAVRCGEGY